MTATISKKGILADLKVSALKIESLEAQLANTFDLQKREELKKQLKMQWVFVDALLDGYNAKKILR